MFEVDFDLDECLVIYYGCFKGGTVYSIKLSATFDASSYRFVVIVCEWDLMMFWNVYVIEMFIMFVCGFMYLVVYFVIWFFWSLSV